MSALKSLANPERFELISEQVKSAIDADLLDFEYVERDTFDPDNGFDVIGLYICVWRRLSRRTQGAPSWGTHQGSIRGDRLGNIYTSIFNGRYDLTEDAAMQDFRSRQVGLR